VVSILPNRLSSDAFCLVASASAGLLYQFNASVFSFSMVFVIFKLAHSIATFPVANAAAVFNGCVAIVPNTFANPNPNDKIVAAPDHAAFAPDHAAFAPDSTVVAAELPKSYSNFNPFDPTVVAADPSVTVAAFTISLHSVADSVPILTLTHAAFGDSTKPCCNFGSASGSASNTGGVTDASVDAVTAAANIAITATSVIPLFEASASALAASASAFEASASALAASASAFDASSLVFANATSFVN